MTNPSKKEALGKGIRSLLQNIDTDLKHTAGALGDKVVAVATGIERISLDLIVTNPKQPRRDFDEVSLQELSQSIKLHDIIQPITVAKVNNKKYQLIAGERRLRASKLAGLKDIPAYVRQVNDQELLELALLENLQREAGGDGGDQRNDDRLDLTKTVAYGPQQYQDIETGNQHAPDQRHAEQQVERDRRADDFGQVARDDRDFAENPQHDGDGLLIVIAT